jgi:hypothetical protein
MSHVLPKVRELTSHRVNGLNEALRVFVLDGPGPGNACHEYVILQPLEAHDEACEQHRPREHDLWSWYEISSKPTAPGETEGYSLGLDGSEATIKHYDSVMEQVDFSYFKVTRLAFQNGPIKDHGVNGLSQEALLAVLIDRLEGFQSGQYKCHDNEVALDHLQGARLWLHKRTMDRVARQVEGTMAQ